MCNVGDGVIITTIICATLLLIYLFSIYTKK